MAGSENRSWAGSFEVMRTAGMLATRVEASSQTLSLMADCRRACMSQTLMDRLQHPIEIFEKSAQHQEDQPGFDCFDEKHAFNLSI